MENRPKFVYDFETGKSFFAWEQDLATTAMKTGKLSLVFWKNTMHFCNNWIFNIIISCLQKYTNRETVHKSKFLKSRNALSTFSPTKSSGCEQSLPPIDQFLVPVGSGCALNIWTDPPFLLRRQIRTLQKHLCALNLLIWSLNLCVLNMIRDSPHPFSLMPISEAAKRAFAKNSLALLLEVCGERSVQVEIISKRKENT